MSPISTAGRLERLRQELQRNSLDAYFIPSEDAHMNEYIAPRDALRAYISGFTGSAGNKKNTSNDHPFDDFLRICCGDGQGCCPVDRRSLLSPGIQATRPELAIDEAGTARHSHNARMARLGKRKVHFLHVGFDFERG